MPRTLTRPNKMDSRSTRLCKVTDSHNAIDRVCEFARAAQTATSPSAAGLLPPSSAQQPATPSPSCITISSDHAVDQDQDVVVDCANSDTDTGGRPGIHDDTPERLGNPQPPLSIFPRYPENLDKADAARMQQRPSSAAVKQPPGPNVCPAQGDDSSVVSQDGHNMVVTLTVKLSQHTRESVKLLYNHIKQPDAMSVAVDTGSISELSCLQGASHGQLAGSAAHIAMHAFSVGCHTQYVQAQAACTSAHL